MPSASGERKPGRARPSSELASEKAAVNKIYCVVRSAEGVRSDRVVASHTAAKLTCDCDFEGVAPGPVHAVGTRRESVVRVCLLGCTYKF